MAKIGMRNPMYRRMDITVDEQGKETISYGERKSMGKAISANISVTVAEAKLYADDGLAESTKEFVEGSITISTDDIENNVESDILGATIDESGDVVSNKDDATPWIELGYIAARMKSGTKQYRGIVYYRVQFAVPNEDNTTMGQTISFGTPTFNGTLTANADGDWRKKSKWFDKAADATAWLEAEMSKT